MTGLRIGGYAVVALVCLGYSTAATTNVHRGSWIAGFVVGIGLAAAISAGASDRWLRRVLTGGLLLTLLAATAGVVLMLMAGWSDADCTRDIGCGPPSWIGAIYMFLLAFDGVCAAVLAVRCSIRRRVAPGIEGHSGST